MRPAFFPGDRRGVAAVEFAFIAPVLAILLLAGFDMTRYALTTRRIEAVAETIGQMVSVSASGQISPTDLQFYTDSTMVIFPEVLQDSYSRGISWGNDISVTVSSLTFSGTSPSITAMTKWSAGSHLRACNVAMTPVADTAVPSPSTLPQDALGTGSLIVVDVVYTFRPSVASAFLQGFTIARSYYVQPRYVTSIAYTGTASSTVNQC